MPTATVVVPTHNRRALLRATLAGILAQRAVDLEVIVVDNASSDGTAADLSECADPRLRTIRSHTPQGGTRARNRGLAAARGTWVGFCDDDDLWAPDKLRLQIAAAETTGRSWTVGGVVWFTAAELVTYVPTPSSYEITAKLPYSNVVPGGCSNVVARRDVLRAVGGFDNRLHVLTDWDLWLRLVRVSPPAVVDQPLLGYRLHTENFSASADRGAALRELHLVETKSADLRDGLPLDAAWFHRWMGYSALRGGHRRDAAAAFFLAASWTNREPLLRALAALIAPTAAWRTARRLRSAQKSRDGPPPAWLPALRALEDTAGSGSRVSGHLR
jgi:glycosyltransferase involved in cell wall biosynthesis